MSLAHTDVARTSPACIVLTERLAEQLKALNVMTRRLHQAGVRVVTTVTHDTTVFIHTDDAMRFAQLFRSELRGIVYTSKDKNTLNSVRIGLCRICWITPIKEQD